MGAITGTKTVLTEFAGVNKILHITATIASASDTITLTEADHGITTIVGIVGAVITGGMDDKFQSIQVSYSGLVVTVVSKDGVGGTADDFTGTTVSITLIGY